MPRRKGKQVVVSPTQQALDAAAATIDAALARRLSEDAKQQRRPSGIGGPLTKAETKWLNDPDPDATFPGGPSVVIPHSSPTGWREFLASAQREFGGTKGTSMRLKTEFFKSGDSMAIRTNARTEDDFIRSAAEVLDEMIESGRYDSDWEFQLARWLPQIVDITCKLRGYKADVEEERVLIAGGLPLGESERVGMTKETPPPAYTPRTADAVVETV